MKKILKSLLIMTLAVGSVVGSTRAWFTSEVSAEDNVITTGTLRLGVAGKTENAMRWITYDDAGTQVNDYKFAPITNIQPGESKTLYYAVVNRGSLPFYYRQSVDGYWDMAGYRPGAANYYMRNQYYVDSLHRFAGANCESDTQCIEVRNWLTGKGYTAVGVLNNRTADVKLGHLFGQGENYNDSNYMLDANEFTVYKIELGLKENTGNEFQGQDFLYDLLTEAKQTTPGAQW